MNEKLHLPVWSISIFLLLLHSACQKDSKESLFTSIPSSNSGITFNNEIIENDSFNILSDEFMYNGGGIGIGDFDQDGLFDLYFTGNEVANKLYLNKGNFQFQDITETAGVGAEDIWSSGVTIVDINNDGLPDIYVSATFRENPLERKNKFYINQGKNGDGLPTFIDQASSYGLADTGYTTQTYFFDHDLDGDLDAFLLNDKLFSPRSTTDLNQLMEGGEETIDQFYRNDGNNNFEDVSEESGFEFPGFGLGAAIFDVNQDGYLDIYVSNDFISNDLLYVNQKDGTFENQIGKYFKHHSFSSMGVDASDMNGDGLEDIMTLDMLPENQARMKRTYAFHKYKFYDLMDETGYTMQYNRNTFQVSNIGGKYADVSEMAGVDATEWSWSVLFADLDNDALKDIAITNGFPRDITDMDFTDYNASVGRMMDNTSQMLAQIPIVKVRNYFYQNKGDQSFEDVSVEWGMEQATFSNGAATVDLDNDGDLDYVFNNINDPAGIYENQTNLLQPNNFLRVQLAGNNSNRDAIGAKVKIYWDGQTASALNIPTRGFISSIEPVLHFGLGAASSIDSLIVEWPNGEHTILEGVNANQFLEIDQNEVESQKAKSDAAIASLYTETTLEGLDYKHSEVRFYDYNFQGLLPRMHSREGPGIAVGDLNGDEVEDFVFGNGSRSKTKIYYSNDAGTFDAIELEEEPMSEDMGVLIFDANMDGRNDLYISSGSTEFRRGSGFFKDKLFLANDKGELVHQPSAIPSINASSASVSAADYDQDGDLDLFVAGRLDPQNYPKATSSYIFKNENGSFIDATQIVAPGLYNIGLATQGLWTDYDNDGWVDLIVVGEWMPIQIFKNNQGEFKELQTVNHTEGWWNSISGADLDNDGDIDYVLGNQGLNHKLEASKENPVLIFAHDFDQNGSVDPIIAEYQETAYYPVHLKMDLTSQLVSLKKRFLKYEDYAKAKMEDILPTDTLEIAEKYKAKTFASAILWNEEGSFTLSKLPKEAQVAPIYATLCEDVNNDGLTDILIVGNRYSTEVFQGRLDALNGLVLLNKGNQAFKAISSKESGIVVDGDAKTLVQTFDSEGNRLLVAGINDSEIRVFQRDKLENEVLIVPEETEETVVVQFKDGSETRKELYRGSSFLSQSSRKFLIDTNKVNKLTFYKNGEVSRESEY